MEVGRGLVYPCQIMLDDVQIDTSSYVVVKVDMVHDNSKDLKLKVSPVDTTLTMLDVVTRRVQWRWTSIDIDPSAVASALTTPSQSNTSPASMSPKARCLQFETWCVCLQFQSSCIYLQFEISCRSLQFKSSCVGLDFRLRVPCSMHLIRCRQRRQRMYVARVTRSSGRCPPRQQRARN
jgi:hypothetical protein